MCLTKVFVDVLFRVSHSIGCYGGFGRGSKWMFLYIKALVYHMVIITTMLFIEKNIWAP
jgi:hypothetical protein